MECLNLLSAFSFPGDVALARAVRSNNTVFNKLRLGFFSGLKNEEFSTFSCIFLIYFTLFYKLHSLIQRTPCSFYYQFAVLYCFLSFSMCFRTLSHCIRTLKISIPETSTCAFETPGTVQFAVCQGPKWTWWREFPMTITGHSRESDWRKGFPQQLLSRVSKSTLKALRLKKWWIMFILRFTLAVLNRVWPPRWLYDLWY